MRRRITNAALALASISLILVIVVLADRLLGLYAAPTPQRVGILFPPGSTATYSTMEFEYTVHINNLGFRGGDTTLASEHDVRILAIGDSFTYGWGVEIDETWIKRVERALRDDGLDVEVLNLGVPGLNPYQYAETAAEAIPLLNPDLVIVGLLQEDDLRQLDSYVPKQQTDVSVGSSLDAIANTLFPNLVELFARNRTADLSGLNERSEFRWKFFNGVWEQQVNEKFASLDDDRRARFRAWPEDIQSAFREGRLNPALLTLDFVWGQPSLEELDPTSEAMQVRISRCADALGRIKSVADRNGAQLAVVLIPSIQFVVPSAWLELGGADQAITEQLLSTTGPDDAARQACDRAGVPLIEVIEEFRELEGRGQFYFPYDLHFTPEGHNQFGALIAPHVSALIEASSRRQ